MKEKSSKNKRENQKEKKKQNKKDIKYIWNLEDIYKDISLYKKDLEELKKIGKEMAKYEGKLNNKKDILEYFNLGTKKSRILDKLSAYVYLNTAIDMDNNEYKMYMSELENVLVKISEDTIFDLSELKDLEDSTLKEYMNDPDFKNSKYFFEKLIEEKKHIFSKDIEQIIDYASAGIEELYSMYNFLTELEMPFKDAVDKNGKTYPVTNSMYGSYLESKDEVLRKTAMFSRLEGYKSFNNSLASAYIGNLKNITKMLKCRKYKSKLDAKLKGLNLSKEVYLNLVNGVEDNLDTVKRYKKLVYKIYKKMGLVEEGKRIKPWDTSLKPFEKKQIYIPYEDAKETVISGLSVLGDGYLESLKHILENRYVDVFPRKGKESGGFNLDIYDVHPYILLNYEGTHDDVTTIAHELGHAMHGIYAKEQDYELHDYSTIIAETASTTNEVIMANYLIENEKDKIKKAQMLLNFIDTIFATLVTQTMFSRFEEKAFKLAEDEDILTPDVLNNIYKDLDKKYAPRIYTNKDKENETKEEKEEIDKIKELRKYSWTRVPHFYRPFYVFSYSIGITAAINIYLKIMEDEKYLDKYINMLKSGGSKKIMDTFKIADIDLEDKNIYKNAFKFVNQKIDELEKIVNEI